MNQLKVLKTVNVVLFLCVLIQAITGLVIFFLNEGRWVERTGDIHKYNGLVLVVLIGIHLYLNWSVIKNHYFKKQPAAASVKQGA